MKPTPVASRRSAAADTSTEEQTPEPVARVPVDVRSVALTSSRCWRIIALKYAQAMLIPIVSAC